MTKKKVTKKVRKPKTTKKILDLSFEQLVPLLNTSYPEYSENALEVMKTHYFKKDLDGNFLETTPDEVFKRVAEFYRRNAHRLKSVLVTGEDDIFDLVRKAQRHKMFTFNSPTYYNADPKNLNANMFACFVGNLYDSMDSISREIGRCVSVFKEGAGIGNNIGKLRPKGASIGDGGLHFQGESGSSGPLSFMSIFNETGVVVKAAGKRRAAIMTCMFDDHPDLPDFITCKSSAARESYTGMNLSVLISEKFMKAVENDDMWDLTWKKVVYKSMRAKELFDLQAKQAWAMGDPGWLFRNAINQGNATPSLGEIISTNPCVVGYTLIAVADGRNFVPIQQLAEEGKDVLVYSTNNENGKIEVKCGRNPRMTGTKREVWKLLLDDGTHLLATPDHGIKLNQGSYKNLSDLLPGDSVLPFNSVVSKAYHQICNSGNHKVVSVKFYGYEDVYNLTVDDNHNYNVITKLEDDDKGIISSGICVKNCGEIPLPPSTSCNLAAINLYQTVSSMSNFNFDEFFAIISQLTRLIVPFLSENAYVSQFPDKEFEANTQFCAPLGLGLSGFGELLFKLSIPYGSADSQQFARQIMEEITLTGFETSAEMAEVWGACEAWKVKDNANALLTILSRFASKSQSKSDRWKELIGKIKKTGVRNMYITAIAPTGNTGIFSDAFSGGMEPLYALHYNRNLATGGQLEFTDPEFGLFCNEYFSDDLDEKVEFLEEIKNAGGMLTEEIKENFDLDGEFDHFVTAHNLDWHERVDMQAAFQDFCCLSISSTVNLAATTTVEEIREIAKYAHHKGLKGLTIYRDGSLDDTPLETTGTNGEEKKQEKWVRPQMLNGVTLRYIFNGQDVFITVNSYEDEIVEIFVTMNNCDADTRSFAESLTKRVSKDLQKYHVSIQSICNDLIGVPSGRTERIKILSTDKKPAMVTSLPDLIGQVLRRFSIDKQEVQHIEGAKRCPKCLHYTAIPEEGCLKCINPKCLHVDCSI